MIQKYHEHERVRKSQSPIIVKKDMPDQIHIDSNKVKVSKLQRYRQIEQDMERQRDKEREIIAQRQRQLWEEEQKRIEEEQRRHYEEMERQRQFEIIRE